MTCKECRTDSRTYRGYCKPCRESFKLEGKVYSEYFKAYVRIDKAPASVQELYREQKKKRKQKQYKLFNPQERLL